MNEQLMQMIRMLLANGTNTTPQGMGVSPEMLFDPYGLHLSQMLQQVMPNSGSSSMGGEGRAGIAPSGQTSQPSSPVGMDARRNALNNLFSSMPMINNRF